MARTFRTDDWNSYRMDYKDPHRALEPLEKETAVVGEALDALQQEGVLPHTRYDHQKMLAHRNAVGELFEIPWTAITPRMERLLYAVNAITRPQRMVAAGVFCGFTFISNAAAAVGPGACYSAEQLIGVEIEPDEARRAECNLRRIDPEGVARIVAADAVEFVASFQGQIGLLYLDADGAGDRGKGYTWTSSRPATTGCLPGRWCWPTTAQTRRSSSRNTLHSCATRPISAPASTSSWTWKGSRSPPSSQRARCFCH